MRVIYKNTFFYVNIAFIMENPTSQQVATDTNMFISVLANSERLKPPRDIIHFEQDVPHDMEEKIESLMDEESPKKPEHIVEIEQNPSPVQVVEQPKQPEDELDEYDKATPNRKKLLKMDMMRKLMELVQSGVKLSQDYNMDSDYKLMKYEYELHSGLKAKHGMVSWVSDACITGVGALETLNKKFNKFGLRLDGWSDKVSGKSEELYDAFSDMYEKYVGPGGHFPPELRLIGILGFSAATVHITNSAMDKMPKLEDELKKDPEYLEKIRNQAIGNTQKERMNNQEKTFTEKREKEYQNIINQARDFQQYRKYEDEYNKTMADQVQFKPPTLPQSLRKQATPQQNVQNQFNAFTLPTSGRQQFATTEMTPEEFAQFREKEIEKHRQKMLKSNQRVSRLDNESNHSQESVVEVNPNLNEILKDAETASNMSGAKTCKRRNKKKDKTIKIDV